MENYNIVKAQTKENIWVTGYLTDSNTVNAEIPSKPGKKNEVKVFPATVCRLACYTEKGSPLFVGDIFTVNSVGTGVIVYENSTDEQGYQNIGYFVKWLSANKDISDNCNYLRTDLGFWLTNSELKVVGNIKDRCRRIVVNEQI